MAQTTVCRIYAHPRNGRTGAPHQQNPLWHLLQCAAICGDVVPLRAFRSTSCRKEGSYGQGGTPPPRQRQVPNDSAMLVLFSWIPLMVLGPIPQSKRDRRHLFTWPLMSTTLAEKLEKHVCDERRRRAKRWLPQSRRTRRSVGVIEKRILHA